MPSSEPRHRVIFVSLTENRWQGRCAVVELPGLCVAEMRCAGWQPEPAAAGEMLVRGGLTSDTTLQKRIQAQPLLEWKALNVRRYKGLS